MSKDEQIYKLWKLLDDIDTLDDAVKQDDRAFREHTRKIHRKRFDVVDTEEVDALYDEFHKEQS
jgi:hypothetical protein